MEKNFPRGVVIYLCLRSGSESVLQSLRYPAAGVEHFVFQHIVLAAARRSTIYCIQ